MLVCYPTPPWGPFSYMPRPAPPPPPRFAIRSIAADRAGPAGVDELPDPRCTVKGPDADLAENSCRASCGCPPLPSSEPTTVYAPSPAPTVERTMEPTSQYAPSPAPSVETTSEPTLDPDCVNSPSWFKKDDPSKHCDCGALCSNQLSPRRRPALVTAQGSTSCRILAAASRARMADSPRTRAAPRAAARRCRRRSRPRSTRRRRRPRSSGLRSRRLSTGGRA